MHMRKEKFELMNKEDSKYFNTTKTTMRRVRTMLERLAKRSDIIEVCEKCNYAADKVDNALSMLELLDQYASETGYKQLKMDFGDEGNNA